MPQTTAEKVPAQEQTKSPVQSPPNNPETDQSVYISDKNMVKTYPRDMSNDEINFDIHTTVRAKTPEDYFLNFLPLTGIQKSFNSISLAAEPPPVQVTKALASAFKFEKDVIDPALKLAVLDPEYAFGFSKETSPEVIADTYKPWLDIWLESEVGKNVKSFDDKMFVEHPKIAPIPWFFAEFVPEQLLDFGTKPSNWIGAYGIEKFGPPILNSVISKLPRPVRETLLKEIFAGEKALQSDFETLGIPINSKTSSVVNAHREAAKVTHPDLGGDAKEFIKINQAYENIMKSRGGWMDQLFDLFRGSKQFKARKQPKIMGLLSGERGSMLIPFSEGDLVRVGEDLGQIVKIAGEIAAVNIAGKIVQVPFNQMTAVPKSAVNTEHLKVTPASKEKLGEATKTLGKDIENQTGKPLTHEEVIKASKEAEILTKGVSREATLAFEASLLKTRQHLAALAEQNELTPEFLDTLRIMANHGTDIARNLESFKIDAVPEYASLKVKIIKDLIKLGKTSDEILKAAKGVDFKDEQSVAKFYRQFVKPTLPEILDEFVYRNILSSPLTHIVNATSNVIQLAGLNPLTKLASGAVDFVASGLRGKERAYYISEVPDFYKGALNSVPKAFKGALEALKGKKNLERPDIKHLPTLSKLVDWGTLGIGKYVPRALEASDVFFRTMIEAGEVEAMSKKLGHSPDAKEMAKIQKEAGQRADYYVFRTKPDAENKTGQGSFLSAIDQLTNAVYRLRAVPGFKWFIRFVQTPMNILKQMIEYSPAGLATMPGAKDKAEQAGKTILGSLVFAGASWLAAMGRTTWSAPSGDKEKEEFYAAGLQPYSVRIGNKWVSYSKIGPLSGPLAMAAALHYFSKDSPDALTDSEMDKVVNGLAGLMKFFSDQSYMQGIGDLLAAFQGEKSKAIASLPTQLIPLSSLQGWVNNIIDELQRQPDSGLSIDSVVQNIEMKIIGMSKLVPPRIDSDELPVKKQMKEVNAVSPLRMSKVNPGNLAEYKENQRTKQEMNKIKKDLEA